MTSDAQTLDPAPDWSAASTPELCCPLCEYNLRGLVEPRCPECGFAFAWSELIRGLREIHPYLFEHHPKRNVWSFWKTYWNNCRPRKFWRTLNPAQPVRINRLILFWAVSNLILLVPYLYLFGELLLEAYQGTLPRRWSYVGMAYGPMLPPITPSSFLGNVQLAWDEFTFDLQRTAIVSSTVLILAWPWLTTAFLLIFSESMRRAKIKKQHVLRAVIYGTDFGLLMLGGLYFASFERGWDGWALAIMLACAIVTLYRVTFAYSRYLRFHLPFLTVLTSQIIVILLALVVMIQLQIIR